ncbi:MAG: Tryptophan-tRNA ligase [Microgenomates group bacterium GW2011_GWA2_40_6]|nr:MAG: Tryptophan-tRNA ligase [Microgenomates group bacterium GW2011_GWA2_40_6]
MNYPKFEITKKALSDLGVSYELIQHPPIKTVEEGLAFLEISAGQGASTLIIETDKGLFTLLRRDDHQVDMVKVKKILGANRAILCKSTQVLEISQCEVGYVSPYNPGLPVLADETILERDFVYCGTGSPEYDLKIAPKELMKFTGAKTADIIKAGVFRQKSRILTGDRPTGPLHLGHYVGTLKNRVRLQDEYECFFIMADLHTLTTDFLKEKTSTLNERVRGLVLDYLSVGIDPEKSVIYQQSRVPEVAYLSLIFSNLVTVPRAQRVPTLKDVIHDLQIKQPSMGLLNYPILQAADILMVKASLVPVGRDQESHVEVSREVARDFNRLYAPIFPEPKALIGDVGSLVGTDGQAKMSKSVGNCIYLSDDEATVNKKVKAMYTDPTRIKPTDPGHVEGNPVFVYHDAFNDNKNEVADLKDRYIKGQVGDVEVKDKLAVALNKFLEPIRAKRAQYEGNEKLIAEIIENGSRKAQAEAAKTLHEVLEVMGIKK